MLLLLLLLLQILLLILIIYKSYIKCKKKDYLYKNGQLLHEGRILHTWQPRLHFSCNPVPPASLTILHKS